MKLQPRNSPFAILEVAEDVTDEEVRKAYKRLGMKFHPDRNSSEDAERQFKRVQMAYQMVKDEASRYQVIRILDIYRNAEEQSGTGKAGMSGFHSAASIKDSVFSGWLSKLALSLIMCMRVERLPLLLLFFCPYTLYLHSLESPAGIVTLPMVQASLWQGAVAALITDQILQVTTHLDRHTLRGWVNWIVTRVIFISLIMLFYSIDVRGEAVFFFMGSNPDLVRSLSLACLASAVYSWVVFCLIFNKRHPFWESALVWAGVAGLMYYLILVLV